jgi:hypothetical protein
MKQTLGLAMFVTAVLGSGSAFAGELKASYSMPVSSDLLNEASFDLAAIDVQVKDGQTTVLFDLPVDLTGMTLESIQFQGAVPTEGTFVLLTGVRADASCTRAGQWNVCLVSYHPNYSGAPADKTEVYLKQKYAASPSLANRLAVAKLFDSEPHGVLRYPAQ